MAGGNVLQVGDEIGGFVVKGRIGKGGMGEVFLVHDPKLHIDRALKVIALKREAEGRTIEPHERAEYKERFLREARTLARLRHPHIIPVHTVSENDGNPFLVMTHFPSRDARVWLNEDEPTLDDVKVVALQLASALAYAHSEGVLHRDIKLSNILIGGSGADPLPLRAPPRIARAGAVAHVSDGDPPVRDGRLLLPAPPRFARDGAEVAGGHEDADVEGVFSQRGRDALCAMLIDFGLAKSSSDPDLTHTGRNMGTYSYMAPEYVAACVVGKKGIHTARTDLWALGCVLYALTCHRLPFFGSDDMSILTRIQRGDFPSARTLRPDASPEWLALLAELMAVEPEKRPPSARVLVARLEAISSTTAVKQVKEVNLVREARELAAVAELAAAEASSSRPSTSEDADAALASPAPSASSVSSVSEQGEQDEQDEQREPKLEELISIFDTTRPKAARTSALGSPPVAVSAEVRNADAVTMPPLDDVEGIFASSSGAFATSGGDVLLGVDAPLLQEDAPPGARIATERDSRSSPPPAVVTAGSSSGVGAVELAGASVGSVEGDEDLEDDGDSASISAPARVKRVERPFRSPLRGSGDKARSAAFRQLAVPLVAALTVFTLGGALIVWSGGGRGSEASRAGEHVDPDELVARQRSAEELKEIERQKKGRSLPTLPSGPKNGGSGSFMSGFGDARPHEIASSDASKTEGLGEPRAEKMRRGSRASSTASAATLAPTVSDPFRERYGARVDFNVSSGAPVAVAPAGAEAGAETRKTGAGTKVPVRVVDAVASQPSGPVIAIVTQPTRLGSLTLPSGTAIHGQTAGTSGSRLLLAFSFAIVDGKTVSLRGTALGLDGRAGIQGTRSLGGASDVAAGGAVGGAQAAVDVLAGAASSVLGGSGVAAGAVRGAGGPGAQKLSRLNNEEEIVTTARGARFFVYVEQASL